MSHHHATLLIVDPDDLTRDFLTDNLTADGYRPLAVESLADARMALREGVCPHLIVCDTHLPDGSGHTLVREIRSADGIVSRADPATPVVMLSARGDELDRVRSLECGSDDVLVRPYSYPELRLRIAGLLRRSARRPMAGVVRIGALLLDPSRRAVAVRGTPVALTQKEYTLLLALVREPSRVMTKADLLRTVWGFENAGVTRTIDSHACRLRRKLGVHGDEFVVNVWGVGYRLVDAPVVVEQPVDDRVLSQPDEPDPGDLAGQVERVEPAVPAAADYVGPAGSAIQAAPGHVERVGSTVSAGSEHAGPAHVGPAHVGHEQVATERVAA